MTVEETFRRLTELIVELDAEQRRAVEEGLSEDELALFDLLKKEDLGKVERERVKQASRDLLASIKTRLKIRLPGCTYAGFKRASSSRDEVTRGQDADPIQIS